jgi:hypothetical protein
MEMEEVQIRALSQLLQYLRLLSCLALYCKEHTVINDSLSVYHRFNRKNKGQ